MSDIQARVASSNAKIQAELANRARLHDAAGKAIVLIWMGAAVFFGFMLSEPNIKLQDQIAQESSYEPR
ncbi:hypothetical protein HB770_21065 [Rhizobium leguminosarum bv. viciae]|uniref:Transmembrane protein n=1 Tax=Rhizobium leguminosarum bv. viciae TaxID=387 RepID=A0A7G6RL62_RHILV|nr:hypothetical protein HB770_21065 [Rhizobium leguminosarum bv. viciae]